MQNKIFKHLLTLFFVLVLLTIFGLHWRSAEKFQSVNETQMEEQKKAEQYLKNFGIPPEYGVNPTEKTENKTAENNK